MYQRLNDTSSPKSVSKRTKGQPEGSAVTGKTRKPGVTEMGLVPNDVTGQNNSNLASSTALVVYGEWELILVMSSHYCFYTLSVQPRNTIFIASRGFLPPPRIGCFSLFLPPNPPYAGLRTTDPGSAKKLKSPIWGI